MEQFVLGILFARHTAGLLRQHRSAQRIPIKRQSYNIVLQSACMHISFDLELFMPTLCWSWWCIYVRCIGVCIGLHHQQSMCACTHTHMRQRIQRTTRVVPSRVQRWLTVRCVPQRVQMNKHKYLRLAGSQRWHAWLVEWRVCV